MAFHHDQNGVFNTSPDHNNENNGLKLNIAILLVQYYFVINPLLFK